MEITELGWHKQNEEQRPCDDDPQRHQDCECRSPREANEVGPDLHGELSALQSIEGRQILMSTLRLRSCRRKGGKQGVAGSPVFVGSRLLWSSCNAAIQLLIHRSHARRLGQTLLNDMRTRSRDDEDRDPPFTLIQTAEFDFGLS